MTKDIASLGTDVKLDTKTDKYKAYNLLSVQLAQKNYAPDFGVDLDFFINSDYRISAQSFITHIIKRMTDYSISVTDVTNNLDEFILNAGIIIKDK